MFIAIALFGEMRKRISGRTTGRKTRRMSFREMSKSAAAELRTSSPASPDCPPSKSSCRVKPCWIEPDSIALGKGLRSPLSASPDIRIQPSFSSQFSRFCFRTIGLSEKMENRDQKPETGKLRTERRYWSYPSEGSARAICKRGPAQTIMSTEAATNGGIFLFISDDHGLRR